MERLGNGIQATPRDAMVADIAPPNRIGASYGLKRSLATAGSFFWRSLWNLSYDGNKWRLSKSFGLLQFQQ